MTPRPTGQKAANTITEQGTSTTVRMSAKKQIRYVRGTRNSLYYHDNRVLYVEIRQWPLPDIPIAVKFSHGSEFC